MKSHVLKLAAIALAGAAALLTAPAMAQVTAQSCASNTVFINTQVSITKQSFVIQPDGYVTNYYTGWNGNCWTPAQDAFVFANLGAGPFNFTVTIYDPQNSGFKFTDSVGTGCVNAAVPTAGNSIVFAKIDNKGRVGQLYPWPIPGLSPHEQGEYYNFFISADRKSLSFTDRDNVGPDYHFGVYICDPSANSSNGVWVFLSDPGQQPKGN